MVLVPASWPRLQAPTTRHTPSGLRPQRACRTIGEKWPCGTKFDRVCAELSETQAIALLDHPDMMTRQARPVEVATA